jgi:hypothetical protein
VAGRGRRAGAAAAAARTTRCSAPSAAVPANMLPRSSPAPGNYSISFLDVYLEEKRTDAECRLC